MIIERSATESVPGPMIDVFVELAEMELNQPLIDAFLLLSQQGLLADEVGLVKVDLGRAAALDRGRL